MRCTSRLGHSAGGLFAHLDAATELHGARCVVSDVGRSRGSSVDAEETAAPRDDKNESEWASRRVTTDCGLCVCGEVNGVESVVKVVNECWKG